MRSTDGANGGGVDFLQQKRSLSGGLGMEMGINFTKMEFGKVLP